MSSQKSLFESGAVFKINNAILEEFYYFSKHTGIADAIGVVKARRHPSPYSDTTTDCIVTGCCSEGIHSYTIVMGQKIQVFTPWKELSFQKGGKS